MAPVCEQLAASLGSARRVFENRNLRRLQSAWWLSITAEWAYVVALAVYAYGVGGPLGVGIVAVIRMIPAAVAAPFAALLADRYRRERILRAAEVLRACSLATAALALTVNAPAGLVYVLAGLVSVISTVYRPAHAALLPSLAGSPEELTASNVSTSTIESLGTLVGPTIGGVLIAVTSIQAIFGVAAAAYALSAILIDGIRTDVPVVRPTVAGSSVLHEALAGFRELRSERQPRLLVGMFGAQTLVRGSLNVLIVVAAIRLLKMGAPGVGYLTSAIGAGGLIGAAATFALIGQRRLARPFGIGIVLWGMPIAAIGLAPHALAALGFLLVLGVGNSLVDVAGLTLLQRTVPEHVLARVLGVLEGLVMGTIGLGAILAPLLTSRYGVRVALVATGALLPILAILSWPRLRRIDAESEPLGEAFELLRRLPFFEPLSLPTLEFLTAQLGPVEARLGEGVIREGDAGDRFYVIAEGKAEVSAGGRHVATLGAGDYFGEIALLKDIPRTASVTAVTDLRLFALGREAFIGAVTGHTTSAEAAGAAMVARLQTLGPRLTSL